MSNSGIGIIMIAGELDERNEKDAERCLFLYKIIIFKVMRKTMKNSTNGFVGLERKTQPELGVYNKK